MSIILTKMEDRSKTIFKSAIECIHSKMELDNNIDENDLIHLKNGLNKKVINTEDNYIDKIKN